MNSMVHSDVVANMVASAEPSPLVVVLPGDNVTEYVDLSSSSTSSTSSSSLPKLGTGLRYDPVTQHVVATCAGTLQRHKNRQVYYVQTNPVRRYRPSVEDRIVGIVQGRAGADGMGGDYYRVDIGASHLALLSNLQFEGASKRNKPSLQNGQLIYARVASLHQQLLDPTLSCINGPHDTGIPRKDWMTNEGCYGELRGGTWCKVTTHLARELLHPENIVLSELASCKVAFEIAIGVNGYLWIHSHQPEYTILIVNAIQNSAVLTPEQIRAMVRSLVYTVQKQLQQKRDVSTPYEE